MENKSEKEELIVKVINSNVEALKGIRDNHQEMIDEYQKSGFGDIHPDNIEEYKTGLSYTLGYTIGHLELLNKINELVSMSPDEIKELILDNEKFLMEKRRHLDNVLVRSVYKNRNK